MSGTPPQATGARTYIFPIMNQDFRASGLFQERTCTFSVNGQTVQAIITRPDPEQPPRGGIVFSHGWSGFRSGPAGIMVQFARNFAKRGYASIRFDYRGRGESQGSGLEATLTSMADDLVAATAFFRQAEGIDRPAFCGICSGGNVIVGSLKRLPQASRLLLLSVYPFSDGDAFGRDVHRTFHYLAVYTQKLARPDTWARFFRGEVKLANVFQVIFGHFLHRGANRRKEGQGQNAAKSDSGKLPKAVKASAVESRTQGKEPPRKYLASLRPDLPGIIVYGTADPDAAAAEKYYGDYIRQHHLPMKIAKVEGANHNFSSPEWRAQAFDHLAAILSDDTDSQKH